jgi:hypothetical protein
MSKSLALLGILLGALLPSCGGSILDEPVAVRDPLVITDKKPVTAAEVQQAARDRELASKLQADLLAALPAGCGVAAISRQLGCEPTASALVRLHVSAPPSTRRQAVYRWVKHAPTDVTSLDVVAIFNFSGSTVRSGGLTLDRLSVTPESEVLPTLQFMSMSDLDADSQREWQEFSDVLARQ